MLVILNFNNFGSSFKQMFYIFSDFDDLVRTRNSILFISYSLLLIPCIHNLIAAARMWTIFLGASNHKIIKLKAIKINTFATNVSIIYLICKTVSQDSFRSFIQGQSYSLKIFSNHGNNKVFVLN